MFSFKTLWIQICSWDLVCYSRIDWICWKFIDNFSYSLCSKKEKVILISIQLFLYSFFFDRWGRLQQVRLWIRLLWIQTNIKLHCRFGLQYCWSTIIYVIHLAFVDLLCCVINMSVNAYSNFSKGWYLGETLCILSAALRYILTYADWMIVALIAFSKCINLLKPRLGKLIFSGTSGHLIAVLLWFIAILVCFLEYFWVILTFKTTHYIFNHTI